MLVVLNSADGSIVWRKHMTEEAKLQPDSAFRGPNGVSIWSTPVVDEKRRQILVSTSSNFTRPATDTENAVIALDIDSGEVNWIFQGTFPDFSNAGCGLKPPLDKNCDYPNHDFDMITPILTTTPSGDDVVIASVSNDVLFAGSLDGILRAFRTSTGEELW